MLYTLYLKLDKKILTRKVMDFFAYFIRYFKIKKITKNELINIEWIKEMNIDISLFDWEKRLNWISWYARIKNWDDFLEEVIESHLPFLDEIILVNNQSKDNTEEICKRLEEKYPNKIKFYNYNYKVYAPWANFTIKSNSIHSFSYFSNWILTRTKYKYITAIDDDNLFINWAWEKIRKYILENHPKEYITFWWINLLKKKWQIWICKNRDTAWRFGDIWFYPISRKTYYDYFNWNSRFVFNLPYKRFWLTFLHLKYLKKNYWLINTKNSNFWKKNFPKIIESKLVNFNYIKNIYEDIYIKKEDIDNTLYNYKIII